MKHLGKIGFAVLLMVLGLGWLPAHSGMMEAKATGMLAGIGSHQATGKVAITQDKAGNPILTLTDMAVDKVPDGRVYLANGGDPANGVEIGKLKQFSGTVHFAIPAGVNPDDYDSVVIWCKRFNVGIGLASLKSTMKVQ